MTDDVVLGICLLLDMAFKFDCLLMKSIYDFKERENVLARKIIRKMLNTLAYFSFMTQ